MLIFADHKGATYVAASALVFGLLLGTLSVARAAEEPAAPAAAVTTTASAAPVPATPQVSLSIIQNGVETTFSSVAKTVSEFLAERGISPRADDFVSLPLDAALTGGERITYRPAVFVTVQNGAQRVTLHSSAATVADLLKDAHVDLGERDKVWPALATQPLENEIVHVSHVAQWTGSLFQPIAPKVTHRYTASMPQGVKKTVAAGTPGQRLVEVRYVRRDDGTPSRTVIATRVVTQPVPTVVEVGTAAPRSTFASSIASAAQSGFASALHFAGSALHMIATAYTASCYGCSGITASGVRAGFGVVAVDPRVIPLGTKLFIPGYGHAVAGDTGGAINGNRIDLGMDTTGQAMQFGRRPITVYVVK